MTTENITPSRTPKGFQFSLKRLLLSILYFGVFCGLIRIASEYASGLILLPAVVSLALAAGVLSQRYVVSLVVVGLLAFIATINAPGFSILGGKGVNLDFGKRIRINGWYRSPWHLRYESIQVTSAKGEAITTQFPLVVEIDNKRFRIADFTPDLIRSLGGWLVRDLDGLLFGKLSIGDPNFNVSNIVCTFKNERLVEWSLNIHRRDLKTKNVRISYEGRPLVRFPATEWGVKRAFGEPSRRYNWHVGPSI